MTDGMEPRQIRQQPRTTSAYCKIIVWDTKRVEDADDLSLLILFMMRFVFEWIKHDEFGVSWIEQSVYLIRLHLDHDEYWSVCDDRMSVLQIKV